MNQKRKFKNFYQTYSRKEVDEIIVFGEISSTPIGKIWTAVSHSGLIAVGLIDQEEEFLNSVKTLFNKKKHSTPKLLNIEILSKSNYYKSVYPQNRILPEVNHQISDYLHGFRQEFDLNIDWSLITNFQELVLQATFRIPFGSVLTYADIAVQIGKPKAARAVGRAEATNPIPLVIPCHRVIGTDGKLHGYGGRGGLETKSWLLQLENQGIIQN